MIDDGDLNKAINECSTSSKLNYLLNVTLGYHNYYFCFHRLETIDTFIKMFKCTFVKSISDYNFKMQLDILTEEEYEQLINKEDK